MRKLLNVLFVTSESAYLTLENETVVVSVDGQDVAKVPLHTIEEIICFSYAGASPALIGYCTSRNVGICFLSPRGKFLFRAQGIENGNVLVRQEQYRIADDDVRSLNISQNMIIGKILNTRSVIDRYIRDYPLRIDTEKLKRLSEVLKDDANDCVQCDSLDALRAVEGKAAQEYFHCFDEMILQQKDTFTFKTRNRRPPLDCTNALLSFVYTLLANDCANACETVGLDPYVGFMHQPRSGRQSLALDLMEEFRPIIGDRFVLKMINENIVNANDFEKQENGAVLLKPDSRKKVLRKWQESKQDEITHTYLKEKIKWGLAPYVQALLLSRFIRGDIDGYPPFFWR